MVIGACSHAAFAAKSESPIGPSSPAIWVRSENAMRDIITFILGNFTLTFFVIGLFASAIALWRARRPRSFAMIVEALFSYFLLFSIGFSYLYNFVLHVFFGKLAASFIGWEDSPFQLEVGFASLGFAAIGFLAFRGSFDLRLAAIVGPACFLWGAAGGHVYQMITAHNFAPGNAGIIFYSDILVPVIGFIFLWLQHRWAAPASANRPAE
jgi:type IV secretory pathway VirB2 component (pilin)